MASPPASDPGRSFLLASYLIRLYPQGIFDSIQKSYETEVVRSIAELERELIGLEVEEAFGDGISGESGCEDDAGAESGKMEVDNGEDDMFDPLPPPKDMLLDEREKVL